MDIRGNNIQYFSVGSSALDFKPVHFRVLEGGQAHYKNVDDVNIRNDRSHVYCHHSHVQNKNTLITFLVICSMVLALVGIAFLSDASAMARKTSSFTDISTEIVTVMPGESIWSIAENHPVNGCSTAEVVEFITQENELSSSMLSSGQQLSVPAS